MSNSNELRSGDFFIRKAIAIFASIAMLSCANESVLEKAKREYESGEYRQAVLIVKHHIKKGGKREPELLFLAAKASLRSGSEAEAKSFFDTCIEIDSSYCDKVADHIREEAEAASKAKDENLCRRLVSLALEYRPRMDFGRLERVAAEILIDRKEYAEAIPHLEKFIAGRENDRASAEAFIDLASSYEKLGATERAIELYREFLNKYPRSALVSDALWELESILFREAELRFESGHRAEAESMLVDLASASSSPMVKERSCFLLGEICEGRGDTKAALGWYRAVAESGSSARLVGRAKEKIEKLEIAKHRK